MNNEDCSYQISLYLKGDVLEPSELTGQLGIVPTKSHAKGYRWFTSNHNEVVERTGLWALVLRGNKDEEFSELVGRMRDVLSYNDMPLDELPGVQVAYLDVLAMVNADADGGGTCEFDLDKSSIAALRTIGLPVQFTVAVVVP